MTPLCFSSTLLQQPLFSSGISSARVFRNWMKVEFSSHWSPRKARPWALFISWSFTVEILAQTLGFSRFERPALALAFFQHSNPSPTKAFREFALLLSSGKGSFLFWKASQHVVQIHSPFEFRLNQRYHSLHVLKVLGTFAFTEIRIFILFKKVKIILSRNKHKFWIEF